MSSGVPISSKFTDPAINKTVAKFIAQRFISRTDVFAMQRPDGTYKPVRREIKLNDILDHLSGEKTYGHYLLDQDSNTKLFALDIDFQETGLIPSIALPENTDKDSFPEWERSFTTRPLREVWKDRRDPARTYLKTSLRYVIATLKLAAYRELSIETFSAYTGSKGAHLYAPLAYKSTQKNGSKNSLMRVPASVAREGALLTLSASKIFTPRTRDVSSERENKSIWDGIGSASLFSVEVYPKQSSIDASAGELGNLLRLPLGVNLKHKKDSTFFIDESKAYGDLVPIDPIRLINTLP